MPELSDKQLKIGIWWVTHRHQLKKWWVALFAAADVLLFLYLLFNIILIILTWTKFTDLPFQISRSVVDFRSYQQANAPQDIQIASTKIIPIIGKANRYHLLTELKNPNEKWAVSPLTFHFVLDGKDLEKRVGFLLPKEERFIVQYNMESENTKPTPQFFIDEINWQRVERPDEVPSLNFEISDTKVALIPIRVEGNSSLTSYSTRVTAEIKNNSFYNFWQVKFIVVLFRGAEPVAVNEATLEKFLALETRDFGISWEEAVPSITKTTIIPVVNVLNPDALFETEVSNHTSLK